VYLRGYVMDSADEALPGLLLPTAEVVEGVLGGGALVDCVRDLD
jgi:hypothetical protein